MSLHGDKVIVVTGVLYDDYTYPHKNVAADRLGYPTSNPITCGNAQVVLLEGSDYAPGALVSMPNGRFAWLPRPMWQRYRDLGGPQGPLDRPLNRLTPEIEGEIEFENGSTIELRDGRASVNHDNAAAAPAATVSTPCPS
jgi:hypothetical protein